MFSHACFKGEQGATALIADQAERHAATASQDRQLHRSISSCTSAAAAISAAAHGSFCRRLSSRAVLKTGPLVGCQAVKLDRLD